MKHFRLILLLSGIFFSCQKELSNENFGPTNPSAIVPTITTTAVTSITNTTAVTGGNISSDGGATVTARGVCWSTTTNPTIANNKTTDGTGSGNFASNITGLTASTVYYVRAYATNSAGTAYGNEISFTTTTTTTALPTVTTAAVGSITALSASCGGTVVADGGTPVTVRGICWSTGANPVATGNHSVDGAGLGVFSGYMSGLTAGTTYHVRAYATNSVGTAYGGDSVFTTTTATPPTADVYVAGYENNGTNNVAKYWKNSVAVSLTNGTNNAEANAVFINGTDVYVAGWEMQAGKKVAKYWKNAVAVNLTNAVFNAEATQIIVVGTDVYVTGREATATSAGGQAKYWKNGTAVNLTTNSTEVSFARSIAVDGADVYVAVCVYNPAPSAFIIKNGIGTDLSAGFVASEANAVFIQGGDIYIAGRHGSYQATYWKNNVVTNLPSSEINTETAAFSIFVSGPDVYACGFEKTSLTFGNIEVAKYWKNGVAVNLTNAVFHASAQSIAVAGTDLYIAGYEENASGNGVAKYWKNGVAVNLTDGSKDAVGLSIAIK